jgi:hypothetical protein
VAAGSAGRSRAGPPPGPTATSRRSPGPHQDPPGSRRRARPGRCRVRRLPRDPAPPRGPARRRSRRPPASPRQAAGPAWSGRSRRRRARRHPSRAGHHRGRGSHPARRIRSRRSGPGQQAPPPRALADLHRARPGVARWRAPPRPRRRSPAPPHPIESGGSRAPRGARWTGLPWAQYRTFVRTNQPSGDGSYARFLDVPATFCQP